MMEKIRKGLRNDEGFTLVELMVVVLIIAILMAIAIPTFLGARQKAQDRAAQSDLRNGLTAAKVFYVDGETYLSTDIAGTITAYEALEPSIDFDTLANVSTTKVAIPVATTSTVVLVTESSSGTFFCIADDVSGGGTTYNSASTAAAIDTVAECNGSSW
ncbi:MAG: prepilin-type N-terminal cleavage/methylation domain-containing protein [Gammaproteobacteria bacterium]|nr:prepilin-type N-terminal cleavage/methylation domain-containing protein [Gammaproteobacteria bacterium]